MQKLPNKILLAGFAYKDTSTVSFQDCLAYTPWRGAYTKPVSLRGRALPFLLWSHHPCLHFLDYILTNHSDRSQAGFHPLHLQFPYHNITSGFL